MTVLRDFFTPERISQLILSLIVVAVAIVVWMIFSRMYRRIRRGRRELLPTDGRIGTITSVVLNIIKALLILIVVMIILEINGIRITSLVAGLGIASAVAGLAVQDLLKDIIMGTHIMTDDFFQVGDVIRYGTTEGIVTEFNLRSTKLRVLADGSVLTVSNRNISEIVKLSDQLYLDLPVSYNADPAHVQEVLTGLCADMQTQIEGVTGCTALGVGELQDSAVVYKIQLICPPERKLELRRKVLEQLFIGAVGAGLQIPYNQMDVHLDTRG